MLRVRSVLCAVRSLLSVDCCLLLVVAGCLFIVVVCCLSFVVPCALFAACC